MNPKTKRRLSIILTGVVAITAAGGTLVVVRKQRTARYYAQLRKEGLAEYAANDYKGALNHLASYIRRSPDDSEALYACAESRLHVEEANHSELPAAIGLLRRFVDLNPDRKDVREELLQLYLKVGFFTETISTSDQILTYAPKDPQALICRARALFYLRKYDEALKYAKAYNEVAPVDFDGQGLTLTIMQRRGAQADEIIGRADELLARHTDDSRFELLKCDAYGLTGDTKSAIEWAKKAAKHPQQDPAFIKTLIRHLDAYGLYSEANNLQEAAARNNSDAQTRDNWVARLLQAGQDKEVLSVIDKEKDLDTNLLVYKAFAQVHLGRTADAQSTVAALADRGKSDAHAAAAAAAIDKTLLHPADSQSAIAACNDALVADAQDPFFLYLAAKAYELGGEYEIAQDHYQQAAINAPAWTDPFTAISKLKLSLGQPLEAFIAAYQAQKRSPDDREALVAAASSGIYLPTNIVEVKEVPKFVETIEKKFPDEQRVYPIHVLLLARQGKQSEALSLLKKALSLKNASPEMLLALASASKNAKLGEEDACFSRYEQLHGMTPQLAFARAAWMASNGHPDDGLKYLEKNQPKDPNADSEWKIDHARYLEFTNNPQAKKEWEDLAEQNPKDVKIQWQALAARSTQSDRPFIAATIDRLRTLRGDKGTFLSIMRARYILQGDKPSDKDLAEVILLLNDVIRQSPRNAAAHQLLAKAFVDQKNMAQAVDELSQAVDIAPENTALTLDLARMLHSQRNFTRARPYIDRVTQAKTTTTDQRRMCAELLVQEGDFAAASHQLELIPVADLTTNDKLSLASLYGEMNEPAKADSLVSDLLKQPTPEAIQLCANLYGSQKRDADAQRTLALLDKIDCLAATKLGIRAAYTARFGSPDAAINQFLQATKDSPTDAASWRQLLTLCILTGRFDDVDHYAAAAHAAIPADASFTALNTNSSLLHTFGTDSSFRSVFVAMVQSAKDAPDIAVALRQFADLRTHLSKPDEPLNQLRQLADTARDNLAVQIVAARGCSMAGHPDQAIDIASRAMQAFPNSAEAARVSAESLAGAGRWSEALTVGLQWRSRLGNAALPADVFLANVNLQLNNADKGLALVQPYIASALKSPDDYYAVILAYVRGLLMKGRTEEAASLLRPFLSSSAAWRNEWIALTANLPEQDAKKWLDYATTSFPSQNPAEKDQIALAFHALGRRTHDQAYEQSALGILEPLAAKEDCDSTTLRILGGIYETENNYAGAEMVYRRALKSDPKQPIVLNNLAMVILHRNGDLNEALSLVDKAISLDPNIPNFFDTQANVLAQQKSYEKALAAVEKAKILAPTDPEFQATRIWLLALSGQQDAANTEFRQLQLAKNYATLSDSSRKRLAAVGVQ
ncbi:MAG: tetratricopeptide repeat protein [Phycisphaerae bacterium]